MDFVGKAVARGVSYGISHGVATNVSRVVSSNITKASTSISNAFREQNVVPIPAETLSQKAKRKIKNYYKKVKKGIKSFTSKKKNNTTTTANGNGAKTESRFDFI